MKESKRKESSRKYYEKNKDKILAKRRQRRSEINQVARDWRTRIQVRVRAAKEKPCADCGESYPWYVMDFDHVRGKKVANVARMVSECRSWEVIAEEIAKCDVVCSNCHRERTHGVV